MSILDNVLPRIAGKGARDAQAPNCAGAAHHSARPAIRPGGLLLSISTTPAQIRALAADWTALFEHAATAQQVFQSYGFVDLWASTHLATGSDGENPGRTPIVLTARRDGRLVLVWPLVETRQLGLRVIGWLGEPVSQYGDVLIEPSEEPFELLKAAYTHLINERRPDLLRLRKVRQDAAVVPLLAGIRARTCAHTEAPFVTLAGGGSAFEDRQTGKAKKNRRRLMRRLEERGQVELQQPTVSSVGPFVAAAISCKREWLQRHGLISKALADPRFAQFMHAAASDPARASGCTVHGLSLDGRPVAVAIGFECKQRLMLHLITHAEDVEKCGAGVLNLEAILRRCEAAGLQAVDLLPPKAEYKLDWADGSTPVCDYVIGLSLAGRVWTMFFDGLLRPRLKHILERLPPGLRRRIAHLMLQGEDEIAPPPA